MAASKTKPDYSALRELFKPHIESFDYFLDKGLELAVKSIRAAEVFDPSTQTKLRIYFGVPEIRFPRQDSRRVYPQECRELGTTYKGEFKVETFLQCNDGPAIRTRLNFGQLPIMLMSKCCNLRGADAQKLIYLKEEATEMGGYFICGGLERLCRLLIVLKRNHPMSLVSTSYRKRGDGYSDKAVVMRCVREDQSAVTVKLYYLQNGSARLGFWVKGREFLLPVGLLLKALIDTTDHEIYVRLTCYYADHYQREEGAVGTPLIGERAQIILDEVGKLSLFTRSDCLKHIGEYFQPALDGFETESYSVVAEAVLRDYLLVHLSSNHDKFHLLIFMLQKLYALVDQTAAPDNADVLQNQEVLVPGHLITLYVKERLTEWLIKSRRQLINETVKEKKFDLSDFEQVKKFLSRSSVNVGRTVENLLKIGKLAKSATLDLTQRDGFTILAERLNFLRFISHFRAVHRGASFTKMRSTTTVRKLMPESWGFLCAVHTPDGEPCGLLNHMTSTCRVASCFDGDGKVKDFRILQRSVENVLFRFGMTTLLPNLERAGPPEVLQVLLDGRVIGSIASSEVEKAVAHIRSLKLSSSAGIPGDLEVGYVPLSLGGAYPGLYLFTSPSRLIRPVKNVSHTTENNIELIGPFEQAFMEIRCPDGGDGGRRLFPATHEEIHPTAILSVVANLTPWSDHNPSARVMYQCQMGKQTMGFSSQALQFRRDVKSYHLQTPQSPIVRTAAYNKYCMDEFPIGTNAIVAVLSYTGYDMEDAMILNKSSVDRGMCRGHIYQTASIDLTEKRERSGASKVFARSNGSSSLLDSDGLPYIGQMINANDPLYSSYDTLTSETKPTHWKGSESGIVDNITVDGTPSNSNYMQKVTIRTRCVRNPVIGDKFSSRHGQKGVCSQLWPDIDMPFSAVTGMRPDLIINPHAFPSRMTIGMLFESFAAKAGCLHGKFIDATPFRNSVKDEGDKKQPSKKTLVVDEIGPMLASHGFEYHGSEVLYSGYYGTELTCEIFIGPVYYQRLRHMVSDKFQVRSTGRVDPITNQPIGGRKHGGGIRFGEMERDSVLAHGAAYLLHDRLHTCSDYHIARVCSICGSLLAATVVQRPKRVVPGIKGIRKNEATKSYMCLSCKTSKGVETVAMPYVFRYLSAELAAMNVRMTLELRNRA